MNDIWVDLLIALAIWLIIMFFVLKKRRRYQRMSKRERELEQLRWQWWWAGNSCLVLILKALLFVGMLCVVANVVFQGIDIRRRNKRMWDYRGQVVFRVLDYSRDADICRIRAELYNGLGSPIQVAHVLPNLRNPQTIARLAAGDAKGIHLTEPANATFDESLRHDEALWVNFAFSTNLLPRSFVIDYIMPDGNVTNAVLAVNRHMVD